jgi:hypothetical protein
MPEKTKQRYYWEKSALKVGAVFLSGSLALVGCGGSKSSGTSASSSETGVATLVFDDLHGGSSIIQVYPGVTEAAADKGSNGTFHDGDKVPAECRTEGRTVHSDPSVGEEDRTSSVWIRIQGTPGLTQYATAVYVENPAALLSQLPEC